MGERPSDDYLCGWTGLANHYRVAEFGQALAVTRAMLERHPDRLAALSHAEACLLVCSGRIDVAVDVMRRVVDAGRWWSTRQLADADLAPMTSHPAFAAMHDEMRDRSERADAEAVDRPATTIVLTPAQEPWCCVVVLHMATVTAAETADIWAPVTKAGVAVVCIESTVRNGDGQPSWDVAALAERDVAVAVERARGLGGKLLLAGGSQGAGVAARLALGGLVADASGYLCVVGAPAPGSWSPVTRVAGAVVVGGGDTLASDNQHRFVRDARAHGLPVTMHEIPDLEHRYPEDWDVRAPGILHSLRG